MNDTLINPDSPTLFVMFTGRCGSVTLMKLLELSSSVISKHEPRPTLLDIQQEMYDRRFDNTEEDEKIFIENRSDVLNEAVSENKIYAESTLLRFFLPSILKILPNSKILHLYRHPGGAITSFMRRGWYSNHHLDEYRLKPTYDDLCYDKWKTWRPFEKNCWIWHSINSYMIECAEKFGNNRIIRMKFEQLIDINTATYKVPFEMIGKDIPDIESIRDVLSKSYNKQKTGDFPKYEDWDDTHKKVLTDIAGDTIKQLNYEID